MWRSVLIRTATIGGGVLFSGWCKFYRWGKWAEGANLQRNKYDVQLVGSLVHGKYKECLAGSCIVVVLTHQVASFAGISTQENYLSPFRKHSLGMHSVYRLLGGYNIWNVRMIRKDDFEKSTKLIYMIRRGCQDDVGMTMMTMMTFIIMITIIIIWRRWRWSLTS